MILAVDAGNTRIKWGLHDGTSWQERGWVESSNGDCLTDDWRKLAQPSRIVASNVAGSAVGKRIEAACRCWAMPVEWVAAVRTQCGVHNGYEDPSQLGVDRWAALIAARAITRQCCVVVNAGTAVTIDALTARGEFLGGMIVPGLAPMRRALAESTAALGVVGGEYKAFPANTGDALRSGAISALAGAIERMVGELASLEKAEPICLLGGGDAELLLPRLSVNASLVDNLVLEGLVRMAME